MNAVLWRSGVFCILLFGSGMVAHGATVAKQDYAIKVVANVSAAPPRIELTWPPDPHAKFFKVSRKFKHEPHWISVATLPGEAVSFVDENVAAGTGYEYQLEKESTGGHESWTYRGYGYIFAGAEIPLIEQRGRVIVLVESSVAEALKGELDRLEMDLVADGWTVARDQASRTDSVPSVKARIQALYSGDPANTCALLLFGNIPVPYSGNIAPDEHANHQGAWPTDLYYADLDGSWTDNSVNIVQAERSANHNVPGDGKFDQSTPPSGLELQVGRVDFSNLTCYANKTPSLSEIDLLRRYLDKNHSFRSGSIQMEQRALLCDFHDALPEPEPFVANSWRIVTPFVGNNLDQMHTDGTNWMNSGPRYMAKASSRYYLWGPVVSWGGYTYASSITADLVAQGSINTVFSTFIGSYLGDWNNESNFLRAALASAGTMLTTCYSGKPQWIFHHMALGETIGFSTVVTQQNGPGGPYQPRINGAGQVHIGLLGDPTLRAHPLAPVSNLSGARGGPGNTSVTLSWQAPPWGQVRGYAIYRSSSPVGPFQRLNGSLATGNGYTVQNAGYNEYYMVKAVALTETPSGSYFNSSHGSIFHDSTPRPPKPPVANSQSVSGPEDQPISIRLTGSSESQVLTYAIAGMPVSGTLSGTAPDLVYSPGANFNGIDSFSFVVSDSNGQSPPGVVSIHVVAVNDPPFATPKTVGGRAGQQISIALQGGDVDGNPITFRVVGQPAHGQMTGSGANYTYVSDSSFAGTDSFSFVANDGYLDSPPETVTIQVGPGNFPPTARSLEFRGQEDQNLALVLQGDDVDLDPLIFEVVSQPTRGQLNGTPPNLIYAPGVNFHGSDTFTYIVKDAVSQSAAATVRIEVAPQNDAPSATSLNLSARSGHPISIALQGADIDGDALTYRIVTQPQNGQLSGSGAVLSYTSSADFIGRDTFTYVVNDGSADSTPGTVAIEVTAGNSPPVARSITLFLNEDQSTSFLLPASDPDNNPLTFQILSGPLNGQLSGTPPSMIYVPNKDFHGSDTVTFSASDGSAQSGVGTVTIQISAVNDVPSAISLALEVDGNGTATVALGGSDPDGNPLTYRILSGPSKGQLGGNAPNFIYTANLDASGVDEFTYAASDGSAESAPATVTIRIGDRNKPPQFGPIADISFGKNSYYDLRFVVSDEDSPNVLVTATTSHAALRDPGSLLIDGSMLRITPALGATGDWSVTLRANDGQLQAETTFRVAVTNAPPAAVDDEIQVIEGLGSISAGTLLSNDHDSDDELLQIASVSPQSQNKAAVTLSDGVIRYLGAAQNAASDWFTYTVRDSSGATAVGTVRVKVGTAPRIESFSKNGDGRFLLRASGAAMQRFRVEVSEDAQMWSSVAEGSTPSTGAVEVNLPFAAGKVRLYRVIWP